MRTTKSLSGQRGRGAGALSALLTLAALTATAAPAAAVDDAVSGGKIVVADRGSGTLTVIDTHTDGVVATLGLPSGPNPPEPMYVAYSPIGSRVFVGDRANDRVVVYDARMLSVTATVPAGAGVFHMWASTPAGQLWVNNDVDDTSTVIDLRTLSPIATVPTPADLVAAGGKPHDVILSPEGNYAYVTVVGLAGDSDYVVQYDTSSFMEIGRAAVGKDPHVALTRRNRLLYVPCQNTDDLYVLDRVTLATVDVLAVPGAHGAGMPVNGRYFYTTNLPGAGLDSIWTIDTRTNQVAGAPVDAPYTVPHNIALTPNGMRLYVTHSGPNDKVSIYAIHGNDPIPALVGEVTTGMNPFGLAYVP